MRPRLEKDASRVTGDFTGTDVLVAAGSFVGGLALGIAYFAMLRSSVDRLGRRPGRLGAVALSLVRISVAIAVFIFVARMGALPLLVSFLGFLAARSWALLRVRRES
jgi:F1F0 ATPase subunit 2